MNLDYGPGVKKERWASSSTGDQTSPAERLSGPDIRIESAQRP